MNLSRDYWAKKLSGDLIPVSLIPHYQKELIQSFNQVKIEKLLSKNAGQQINFLSNLLNLSQFEVTISVFNILLSHYSNQQDLIIGSSFSLSHWLVLRTLFNNQLTVTDCFRATALTIKEAIEHQDYTFPGIDPSNFFRIVFLWCEKTNSIELGAKLFNACDIIFFITRQNDHLFLSCYYNADLYSSQMLERLIMNYEKLLETIAFNLNISFLNLLIPSVNEVKKLMEWGGVNKKINDANKTIVQLFELAVFQFSDKIAIISEKESFTYKQLNEISNQIAHYLLSLNIVHQDRIAICLDRSPLLIAVLLAILKVGAAYIPLDPSYPEKRNLFILKDSQARVVITNAGYGEKFKEQINGLIIIDEKSFWHDGSMQNLKNRAIIPNDLSYILYTSGSTGNPKGIAIAHQQCVNLLNWAQLTYTTEELSGVLAATSICFDLSIFEIFLPLVAGGKIILVEDATDIYRLKEEVRSQITLINSVPSVISFLLDAQMIPNSVETINLAGESLSRHLVNQLYEMAHIKKVYNLYGPSEATTYATYGLLEKSSDSQPSIGRPITGAIILLLNDKRQLVPLGVSGEIYISGAGLAKNYFNNPQLTRERFVKIPWFDDPEKIFFKTHDICRYDESGELRFLGRKDHQIKLRGFRIELEEIEIILMSHYAVNQAVVIFQVLNNEVKQLLAYVVLKKGRQLAEAQLKSYLNLMLPKYMIPQSIFFIDKMPLNENKKMDRKKLQAQANLHSFNVEKKKNHPEINMIEKQIIDIWQEILGISNVSTNDNFFDLGGSSLLLAKMHLQLERMFSLKIEKINLFKYPTIKDLVAYLRQRLEGVAIIGLSCRFPGANNLEQFWENLCQGVESIQSLSDADLIKAKVSHQDLKNPNYVKRCASVDGIEYFDRQVFNYTAKEAQLLDPQQRLFLECVWEALENAGYPPTACPGRVGVFATSEKSDYLETVLNDVLIKNTDLSHAEKFLIRISNDKDYLATRVAYKFNLTGPSLNIQTACSSSLAAIHIARQSLLAGECDIAVVGGVCLHLPQKQGYFYQEGMIASPDGHCRAFDAQAQGTVLGSGAGVVILKKLSRAQADQDHIYAILKGSAVNNDGIKKMGYTAPSINGQALVIEQALRAAGIPSDSISYIEAHGTGTSLGDPIEVAALTQAFSKDSIGSHSCGLGSVKTNIGHLDSAAGIAGLIKTVLSLYHKKITPSLHFSKLNPEISLAGTPFYICNQLKFWEANQLPRRAGVSSFGIGGTNAHVILEEAPAIAILDYGDEYFLLPLSAMSQQGLRELVQRYIDFFSKEPSNLNIADICYTAAIGRRHFSNRMIFVGAHLEDFKNQFTTWLETGLNTEMNNFNFMPITDAYLRGEEVSWAAFYHERRYQRVSLPCYPFQREYYWGVPPSSSIKDSPLGVRLLLPFSSQIRFQSQFSADFPAYNHHHRLFDVIVVTGSSHLAMFIAALDQVYGKNYCQLTELFFLNPFILKDDEIKTVQVIVDSGIENHISIVSGNNDSNWVTHAKAKFILNDLNNEFLNLEDIQSRCMGNMSGEKFYSEVWVPGLNTGNSFRWIKNISYYDREGLAESLRPIDVAELGMPLHPGLIETCFQLLNACWPFETSKLIDQQFIFVPFSIESITFWKKSIPCVPLSYACLKESSSEDHLAADVYLLDISGEVILKIMNFEVRKLYKTALNALIHRPNDSAKKHSLIFTDKHEVNKFKALAGHERKQALIEYVRQTMRQFLGVDALNEDLDDQRSFRDFGMDSLMSIELVNRFQKDLGLKLSATFVFEASSISQAVDYFEKHLFNGNVKTQKNQDSVSLSVEIEKEYNKLQALIS